MLVLPLACMGDPSLEDLEKTAGLPPPMWLAQFSANQQSLRWSHGRVFHASDYTPRRSTRATCTPVQSVCPREVGMRLWVSARANPS